MSANNNTTREGGNVVEARRWLNAFKRDLATFDGDTSGVALAWLANQAEQGAARVERLLGAAPVAEPANWNAPDLRDVHNDIERFRNHDFGGQRLRDLLQGAMDMLRAADVEMTDGE